MAASMLQKFQGTLVGAIVGDCIGSVFEGLSWASVVGTEKVVKLVEKIEDDHKNSEEGTAKKQKKDFYEFTDDSAMARSVAKSLIQNNGLDVKDMAKRFTREYLRESDRGYGGSVTTVFHALADSNYEDVFQPAKDQFEGQGSYGNGGSMRICPAGLFAEKKNLDFNQLRDLTEKITLLTHSHVQAIHGAILQSYAVQLALRTTTLDIDSFLQELISKMQVLEQEALQEKQKRKAEMAEKEEQVEAAEKSESKSEEEEKEPDYPYCAKLAKIRDFVRREELPDPNEIRDELGVYIAALDSVPAAIYCFLRASKPIEELKDRNAFERTIMYAISLGGDTDTVATMAGSIAGAHYGLDLIPSSWQLCCEGRLDAMKDAEQLFNLT
ncbi:ADP-ribosylhydrolase ARH3-like [Mercenaria mercenaria]|uniref:ADP-ribosylhydrolase ARH3-like n=1 Tax=Mercenaria mercenaria TaxID=6596 RepID=UPI00234EF8A9|nr:ADP-ribosylhydrolase ARH3-like [Mercenaria mercenaria]